MVAVAQAFDPHHPSALAVYCSDGRFTDAVEALCRTLGHQRFDTVTLPGGPALLSPWPADLSEVHVFSRATEFLIESHGISYAVLLAHQGCGFYRSRCGRLGEDQIKGMQLEHLRAARKVLRRQHPDLHVACYYAQVVKEKVTFTVVPEDAKPG
jgi:hypothetical protein